MLTNIWIVPAEAAIAAVIKDSNAAQRVTGLLKRHFLHEPLNEQPEHLEELRTTLQKVSARYFEIENNTRLGRTDPTCAMARVADGRGFMMTDTVHRKLDADNAASRRVIVFDLAMTPEERGRVAKSICDMWTYQTIAQRDHPYAVSIARALGSIEAALNELTADYARVAENQLQNIMDRTAGPSLESFDQLRNRLDRITAVLSATNYFLKDGVRGTADTARVMTAMQARRIEEMQVRQFSSFRGLDAIISPFESSVSIMENISLRYQQCEHRLLELANLVGGHQHRLHIDAMERSTDATQKNSEEAVQAAKSTVTLTKVAIIFAILATIINISAPILIDRFNLFQGHTKPESTRTDSNVPAQSPEDDAV